MLLLSSATEEKATQMTYMLLAGKRENAKLGKWYQLFGRLFVPFAPCSFVVQRRMPITGRECVYLISSVRFNDDCFWVEHLWFSTWVFAEQDVVARKPCNHPVRLLLSV